MTETADEVLQRWRRVAENDPSIHRRAGYWLAVILRDPSKDNVSSLLNWIRESPENALQFYNLFNEIQELGGPFGITLDAYKVTTR